MLAERGFVARVYNGIGYSEHSFNQLTEENLSGVADKIAQTAKDDYAAMQAAGISPSVFPAPESYGKDGLFEADVEILPSSVSTAEKIQRMTEIMEDGKKIQQRAD